MDLVTGALGNLVPKLLQLLQDEYELQTGGLEKEVKDLEQELESVQAFLRQVAEVPYYELNEQVKIWARQVREASYDMEATLDTFLVRVEGVDEPDKPNKLKRLKEKMSSLFSKSKARHKIGNAIEDIKKQLKEIDKRRRRYEHTGLIVPNPAGPSAIDPRLDAMYKEVTELVGITEPMSKVISLLSSQGDDKSNRKMKIVSVVGIGGLGKTTVAKAVYEKLKVDFHCGAFVPVGRNPDPRKIFRDILIDLKYSDPNLMIFDEKQLIDKLREYLVDKRYFVVIDDMWEPQSWETVKLALPDNHGSRIIITTRKFEVARKADEVYTLPSLSNDNSKKLLYTRIFVDGSTWPGHELDEVSNKILKKCEGIPLAIIAMASLLAGKSTVEWSEVYSSISFDHKDNQHMENTTMKILSFSYYDMPPHLRTCLLYLSAFSEDSFIEKDPLIWKWVAEGFIHQEEGISLLEVGERYYNELVNRSMIQDRNGSGCYVHDMVLDLTRLLSREENFITILNNVEGTISKHSVRRLANQIRTEEHASQAKHVDMPRVRSYIALECNFAHVVPFCSFKLLRVLAIEGCRGIKSCHLDHIGNLAHLRYLGLQGTYIDKLPEGIGALKFLQILDLRKTNVYELPPSVAQLTQLLCICYRGRIESDWLWKLTSLEVLDVYPIGKKCGRRFVKKLGCLRELRELSVELQDSFEEDELKEQSMGIDLMESLLNLHKIQVLSVACGYPRIRVDIATWEAAGFVPPRHLRELRLDGIEFSGLPSSFINATSLPILSCLQLRLYTMSEKDLDVLGQMPELRSLQLKLYSLSPLKRIYHITAGSFQKLRCLDLQSNFVFMVQFIHTNAVPFGSEKKDAVCRAAPPAIMPSLEELKFNVFLSGLKDGSGGYRSLGLEHIASLKKVNVRINCMGASVVEGEEAKAALSKAIDRNPNRPTFEADIWGGKPRPDKVEGKGRYFAGNYNKAWLVGAARDQRYNKAWLVGAARDQLAEAKDVLERIISSDQDQELAAVFEDLTEKDKKTLEEARLLLETAAEALEMAMAEADDDLGTDDYPKICVPCPREATELLPYFIWTGKPRRDYSRYRALLQSAWADSSPSALGSSLSEPERGKGVA